jgi:hypothetical protein
MKASRNRTGRAVFALALLASIAAGPAAADDDRANVYSEFESAYLSNDTQRAGKWLADDLLFRQSIQLPEKKVDAARLDKAGLLATMARIGRQSSVPAAKREDVVIEAIDDARWCATGTAHSKSTYLDVPYDRKDRRRACFRQADGKHLAYELTVDVFFTAADE